MVRNQRNVWILMLAAMLLLTVPLGCTKEPIKPIENPDKVDTIPNPKPDTIPDPKPNPNPQPNPSPELGKDPTVDSIMVDAFHFDSWVYISLEKKGNARVVGRGSMAVDGERRVVEDLAWKERDDWDVALHLTDWRTNGGTSGKGQCAVAKTDEKDFAKVTEVPAPSAFVADDSIQVYYEHKWDKIATFGNALLSDVVTMVHQGGGPPIFAFSPKVLVLRTAKGRYLKLQVTGYMDKAKSLYLQISFRYQELKRQP